MRIKLNTNYCGPDPLAAKDADIQSVFHSAGAVVDLPDKVAKDLIEKRYATVATGQPLGMPKRAQKAVVDDDGERASLVAMNS